MSKDLIARLRAKPCDAISPPAIELEAATALEELQARVPAPRSDLEIVEQTEELARELAQQDGFTLESGNFRRSQNPRVITYWERACTAQRLLTGTDPEDAIDNIEAELTAAGKMIDGIDLTRLKELAKAAETGGNHIYTNPRDSNAWRENEEWHKAASPEAFLALLDALGVAS